MQARLPKDLKKLAFTHSSWVEHRKDSYERLAFLGDSVLSLAISTDLFPRFEGYTAGKLTKLRAQVVSGRACAEVALDLDIPRQLYMHAPKDAGQTVETLIGTERVLASIVEAVIGACYLHYGYEEVAAAVVSSFADQVEFALGNVVDFKSSLQEYLARRGKTVSYRVVAEAGPPHDRCFSTVARVDGKVFGEGSGRSKKESEQQAAKMALAKLKKQ